jgi:hypothetical protein
MFTNFYPQFVSALKSYVSFVGAVLALVLAPMSVAAQDSGAPTWVMWAVLALGTPYLLAFCEKDGPVVPEDVTYTNGVITALIVAFAIYGVCTLVIIPAIAPPASLPLLEG